MSWLFDPVKAQSEGAILVHVPPGAAPGTTIRTDSSTGPLDVQIPRGVWPYGYFEVQDPKNPYPVKVRFEVPATVAAGDLVQVPRSGGELVTVRVPPGAKPGDSVEVSLGANSTPCRSVDQVSPEHVSLTERTKQPPNSCGDSDMTDFNQHKSGCFVNNCCGCPCFCLKTNRQRAALVLEKFEAVPVDRATPGEAVAVAGRVEQRDALALGLEVVHGHVDGDAAVALHSMRFTPRASASSTKEPSPWFMYRTLKPTLFKKISASPSLS